jgi:hypothetical protein
LSESRCRALTILHRTHPLTPAIFAHYMWPTAKSWCRSDHAGREVRRKAGVFLADLERDGLARYSGSLSDVDAGYVLTDWGASATDAAPRPNRLQ